MINFDRLILCLIGENTFVFPDYFIKLFDLYGIYTMFMV